MKKVILFIAVWTYLLAPQSLAAQEDPNRSYHYRSIDYTISVNQDTTFDVEEKQTYIFKGEYHAAERSIPFRKIDAVTDISVSDSGGMPLEYSAKRLDKTNPTSWGKYTTYYKGGYQYIEWYYDAKDTEKIWIVSYTIAGGISFYNDKDELYWNLFEEYQVPIDLVSVKVLIPDNSFTKDTLQSEIYVDPELATQKSIFDNKTFFFSASSIPTQGIVTIAAGWPKGLIDVSAYWKSAVWIYLPYALSILIPILCLIIGLFYWYFTEKHNKGRGTIVPEYEPPQNLRPAMAEALVKEGISNKAWPATIVDLAVRGYLKITEEEPTFFNKIGKLFGVNSKDYILERLKDPVSDSHLEEYEKGFLAILGNRFSTRELRTSGNSRKRQMFRAMQDLKRELYAETETDTKAYAVPLTHAKYIGYAFVAIFVAFWFAGFFGGAGLSVVTDLIPASYIILVVVTVLSISILVMVMKFNPRLSPEGHVLREKWLGFKMYLQTAERYRMQNLTPEIFEKYLPYAMIFGIEKKWAKHFDGIHMQAPGWYTGAHAASFVSSGSAAGFSPSAFSSSFATSLSSAFSSSGGGASGGGGSAGGGGGGGGGGAS